MLDVIGFVEKQKQELKLAVAEAVQIAGKRPRLCIITDNQNFDANQSYIKSKMKFAEEVGIGCDVVHVDDIESLSVRFWNYNGVIIQFPFLDYSFDEFRELVSGIVPPSLDVDGLGENALFDACTPLGIKLYIEHLRQTGVINKENITVNIIGYGGLVGEPLAKMLMKRKDYTVCVTRSTTDSWVSDNFQASADVIVCATPKHNLIKYPNLYKVYIDCGCNLVDGKLLGNVSREAYCEEGLITPVPNGVGKLTVLSLYKNVFANFLMRNLNV